MSLKILKWPDASLEFPSGPVEEFNESLEVLVQNMFEIMRKNYGTGLAAIQIGNPARIFVMSVYRGERRSDEQVAFINPVVEEVSTHMALAQEGCLSMPNVFQSIPRPNWVKGHAYRVDGTRFEFEYADHEARCILHEMDHLDGILMTKHMNRLQRRTTEKMLRASRGK